MAKRMITVDGASLSITEWAERSGISRDTIAGRLKCGWPEKDSVTKPAHKRTGVHYKTVSTGNGESVHEHVLIAEMAIGKALPKGSVVHHVDGDKNNNANNNLVICQSQSYHALLHARMTAMKESGDPSKRMCAYCKRYDDVSNLAFNKSSRKSYHRFCDAFRAREYRKHKKSQAESLEIKA